MALRSRITGIVFVGLAICFLPFVIFGTSEATVGGGVTWMILLLGSAGICFIRASVLASREQADRKFVQELLPNEIDRRGEP